MNIGIWLDLDDVEWIVKEDCKMESPKFGMEKKVWSEHSENNKVTMCSAVTVWNRNQNCGFNPKPNQNRNLQILQAN